MSKKKVCKHCKLFVEGDKCPSCNGDSFATSWQGRIFVQDVAQSSIAEKISLKVKGEYAIKIR